MFHAVEAPCGRIQQEGSSALGAVFSSHPNRPLMLPTNGVPTGTIPTIWFKATARDGWWGED